MTNRIIDACIIAMVGAYIFLAVRYSKRHMRACRTCKGTGDRWVDRVALDCLDCDGRGTVWAKEK